MKKIFLLVVLGLFVGAQINCGDVESLPDLEAPDSEVEEGQKGTDGVASNEDLLKVFLNGRKTGLLDGENSAVVKALTAPRRDSVAAILEVDIKRNSFFNPHVKVVSSFRPNPDGLNASYPGFNGKCPAAYEAGFNDCRDQVTTATQKKLEKYKGDTKSYSINTFLNLNQNLRALAQKHEKELKKQHEKAQRDIKAAKQAEIERIKNRRFWEEKRFAVPGALAVGALAGFAVAKVLERSS